MDICQDIYLFITEITAFRQVTHEETHTLLAYQRPQLLRILPSSHSTLVDYIKQAFQQHQEQLRDILHSAQSNIYLIFDIWTLTNGLSMLGIVGHFLDSSKWHQIALLGLPHLCGKHLGENIMNCLARIINDYQLTYKLGLFQINNTSNNNTCMKHLMLLVLSISS